MSFRYWLADLISGGELTKAWSKDGWTTIKARRMERQADDAKARLDRIAAIETPHANATVRKMAKIARGEA